MKKINKKELHEIFNELRNKSQNAYNKLYENYYSLVYGITFSILKNKYDCEDVTQEIFTKIYMLDADKLPTSNEASWLYTVSKNECFLRIRKSKPDVDISEVFEIPEQCSELEEIVDIDYYNRLMCKLRDDEKMIVSLKILSDFTFKKISQIMGIPIGTVQWKYYNSINSLRVSVGSLVGAVIAFIIVIGRGEFWNHKKYFENKEIDSKDSVIMNEQVSDDGEENIGEVQINSSEAMDEKSSATQVNVNEEVNQNQQGVEETSQSQESKSEENTNLEDNVEKTLIQDKEETNTQNKGKIDGVQVAILSVGIIFFVIFIIFFKKYQQKVRKKTSKK